MSKLKSDVNDLLFESILKLETLEDAYDFFEDLLTMKEIEAMSQRILAAKRLIEGKTYYQITEETKISSTTLSRVSTCVRYVTGGYKKVLSKTSK
ncbi:YerC/YecD family TrpR-related protein [Acholeplasma laidlawii]|uniref:YerC/YecD family TrpR-related protein n=1 Tax=Acholeplasma laidlawii TaxID=2148 RepID=UPI0015AC00FE|nr:YerC/YecD family TrpR-related protein [Acholeplasma laidlawii]NWH10903.1 TrpR-related protein YerC/YecD [Acholeplasma laidlawii]